MNNADTFNMTLSEEHQKALSIIAISTTISEGLKTSKLSRSTFYYLMNTNSEFRTTFEQTREQFLLDIQEDISFKNLMLHKKLLEKIDKQVDCNEKINRDHIELLKTTGNEFVNKGKQAFQTANRIAKKIEKRIGKNEKKYITGQVTRS